MSGWTLGDVIRRHRKAKGPRWTQTYLGEQCRPRLNKDQVVRAENDRPVEDDTLHRIATALGTTVDALRAEVTDTGTAGNPTVRIPNRTRYTEATPRVDEPADPRGEETEMHHADQVAVIGLLLTMTPVQVREVRTFVNFVVARDRRDHHPKVMG